jgi:hypothetical protein
MPFASQVAFSGPPVFLVFPVAPASCQPVLVYRFRWCAKIPKDVLPGSRFGFECQMPRFFGPDTVLWYYPERPLSGYVFYAIAIVAIVVAVFPFVKQPSRILKTILAGSGDADRDLLMLILLLSCFAPYLLAWLRTPTYFLGGCFFILILTGRLLARCFASSAVLPRLVGAIAFGALVLVGAGVMVEVGKHDEVETLTLNQAGHLQMTRVPGRDLDAVETKLQRQKLACVWATVSFVYPLLFESDEKLAVSDAIFGTNRRIYPAEVPCPLPRPANRRRSWSRPILPPAALWRRDSLR